MIHMRFFARRRYKAWLNSIRKDQIELNKDIAIKVLYGQLYLMRRKEVDNALISECASFLQESKMREACENKENLWEKIETGIDEKKTTKITIQKKQADQDRIRISPLRRGLELAACIILILAMSGTIAIAMNENVRLYVLRLLIEAGPVDSHIHLVEDTALAFDVPREWKGRYFPAYIPDDMRLMNVDDEGQVAAYKNPNDHEIVFCEYSVDSEVWIDTEESIHESIIIDGQPVDLYSKEYTDGRRTYSVVISKETRYLILHVLNLTREDAIRITSSIHEIR